MTFRNNTRRFSLLALLFALVLVGNLYFSPGASAGLSGVTAISAGTLHSQALKSGGQVRAAGDLNIERRGHTATALADGRLLIIGGENQNGQVSDAEVFDSRSRTFALAAKSLVARTDHTATRLADGRVLVIGGRGPDGPLNSTEIYDPETGSFSYGPALNQARAGHSATVLADGRILIAGGKTEASAEIFDPAGQTFTPVEAHLSAARTAHAATLLQSGKVLIAGGLGAEGDAVQSAELFDPATMSFSATGNSMHIARTHPTLRVLPDGKVQVIGSDKEGTMEIFNAEGEYFTAYAHLLDGPASPSEILSVQTREALLSRASTRENISLNKSGDLFARTDYSLSEIPQANQTILAGGVNSAGLALKSAVVMATSSASVTTDKSDYQPGETAIINGVGFGIGDAITLQILHTDGTPNTGGGARSLDGCGWWRG